jgi:hypothetical protein
VASTENPQRVEDARDHHIGTQRLADSAERSATTAPQTWRTFLRNHLNEIVSVDFFTVSTVRLQVRFVFLVQDSGCSSIRVHQLAIR